MARKSYLDMVDKLESVPVYYDMETLDIYCEYLLNDKNKTINHSNLMNLFELIGSIDSSVFMSNDVKMAKYYFVLYYLTAKLEHGMVSRNLCIRYVYDNIEARYKNIAVRDIVEMFEHDTLAKKDLEYVNNMVFAQLNNLFMHRHKVGVIRMIEDLETNQYIGNEDDAEALLQSLITELKRAKRRSKQENRFNLTDKVMLDAVIHEACDRLLSDSQYLKLGIKMLNNMFNGGLENGRTYNFIGGTGGFKSGLLLTILKWVIKYNKSAKPKDPTKRKTVLFVSQENNMWETIERVFNIFCTTDSIKNYTESEIKEMLAKGGFTVVADKDDIDIEFRYYGNEEISVSDIKGMVQELENEGKETVCIIQDYIERLAPPKRNSERRLQLADISNQLHDLAVELEIPIVTASQFNREGVAIVDDMKASGKTDIGKQIGQKHISESFGMLKNIDVNTAIVLEYNPTEKRYYLSFRKLKFRGADSAKIEFFLHPFEGVDSSIMLKDDILLTQSLSKFTLNNNVAPEYVQDYVASKDKNAKKRKILSQNLEIEDEDDIEFVLDQLLSITEHESSMDNYEIHDNLIVLKRKREIKTYDDDLIHLERKVI